VLAVVDYFTKWGIFLKLRDRTIRDKLFNHVFCKYGIPKTIVSDSANNLSR